MKLRLSNSFWRNIREISYNNTNIQSTKMELLFEMMCDTNNQAIRAILVKREKGKSGHLLCKQDFSKAQRNYTITNKELFAIVFLIQIMSLLD